MSKDRGMKIAHLNIRSLPQKIDEVKFILKNNNFNILGLTESFLSEKHDDCLYNIPDYEMVRRDRKNRYGGGIVCYLHKSVKFEHITLLDRDMEEVITVKIKPDFGVPFIISFVYRPPDAIAEWNSTFVDYVEKCYNIGDELLILGDFNKNLFEQVHQRKWISNVTLPLNLKQLVTTATRVSKTTSTLIDHIYSNRPERILSCNVLDCSLSDHYLTYATRKVGIIKEDSRTKISFLDYANFNSQNIEALFSNVSWEHILYEPTTSLMVDAFNFQFNSLIYELIKVRTRYVKSKILPGWFDNDLISNIKFRDNLKRENKWEDYKKTKKYCQQHGKT